MIKELGLQLWSVRDHLGSAEDIANTMKKLKEIGYDSVQTAGVSIPYKDFADAVHSAGLTVCGTHCNLDEMMKDVEQTMENHRILDTKFIGIGGYGVSSADDVKAFIKKANEFADIIYEHGFKFTYHNHSREFVKYGDKTIMDMLVEGLDPVKTSFCLDTYWLQNAGGDVCDWIEKLDGRIDILHLKDMAVKGDESYITEIGNGNMNFEKIIAAAEKIGVKHYVVEQDYWPGDSMESVAQSSKYIHEKFMK